MALTSPRFNSSKRLIDASNGNTLRQGTPSGRAIHLVQMALLDLGFQLPRSTGNPGYSPDGVFGNETKTALMAFQKANPPLAQTGEIDRATMLALDGKFRGYKHRVKLHFRSISLTNVPFQESLTWAEIVYGQYGIKFEFASGMSLGLSEDEETRLSQVDGECLWVISDGDYNELHSLGTPVPSTEMLVYYVRNIEDTVDGNLRGCGGHAPNRPACTVGANGTKWTTAHECGHVLLTKDFAPNHAPSTKNLMFTTTTVFGNMIPVLTHAQVVKMRNHPCCMAI